MRVSTALPLLAAALLALGACGPHEADAKPAGESSSSSSVSETSDFSVYDLQAQWKDQDERDVALGSLAGKPRVVAMVYTSCTHTCPLIVNEMKRLEAALPAAERSRVGFVLVSLDPARDDPARLKDFAATFRLDPAAWTLLTGTDDQVRELAAVLGIRYRAEEGDEISHSNTYLVLDAAGRIVHRQEGLGGGREAALERIRAAVGPRR